MLTQKLRSCFYGLTVILGVTVAHSANAADANGNQATSANTPAKTSKANKAAPNLQVSISDPRALSLQEKDDPLPAEVINQDDPYETYNRHAYAFNDTMDKILFKPVAEGYRFILPSFARKGIANFFSNLNDVPTVLNDLLQGEFEQATSDVWRLFFNTTVGIGGFVDVATKIDLPKHEQDLGLTLAKWGYDSSAYFVIPLLGPSTIRDASALPFYYFMTVYPEIPSVAVRNYLLALDFIKIRAQLLEFEGTMKAAAIDPYVFQRDAYLQHRAYIIKKNTGEYIDADNTFTEPEPAADETPNQTASENKPQNRNNPVAGTQTVSWSFAATS